MSFLLEDFYSELEPTGRLDTLGKLAHMAVGYYNGLPPQLVTPRTEAFRAMALVRQAAAQNWSGNFEDAYKAFAEAQAIFEKLRADGDNSEAITYGLALTLFSEGSSVVGVNGGGRGTADQLSKAADLLRPLASQPDASRRVRLLYASTLNYLSHTQPMEKAVAMCDEARAILVALGALDLSDLDAASSYADVADSEARHLLSLGRIAEAQKLEKEVYDIAEKVLVQRPGDLHALSDRSWAAELLGSLANRQHDAAAALDYAQRAARAGEDEVRFNPSDVGTWNRWATGLHDVSDLQYELGDIAGSLATLRSVVALGQDKRRPSSLNPVLWYHWIELAATEADRGDAAAAARSMKAFIEAVGEMTSHLPPNDTRHKLLDHPEQGIGAALSLIQGASQVAWNDATAVISRIEPIAVPSAKVNDSYLKGNILISNYNTAARAAIRLHRYADAESLARKWLAVPPNPISESDPRRAASRARAVLAHAVALQGRADEARKILDEALAYYRGEQQAGARGVTFRRDFAYALYVSALLRTSGDDRAKRADLDAASAQLEGASSEARELATLREIAGLIASARAS